MHFQRGQHSAAAEEYAAGLAAAQPDQSQLKAVLHCNRAAAMAALGQHTEAVADCCAAITLDPAYLKAFQRRAEAAAALGDVSSAVQVGAAPLSYVSASHAKRTFVHGAPCHALPRASTRLQGQAFTIGVSS